MDNSLFVSRFEYCLKDNNFSYTDFCNKLKAYGIDKTKSSISCYITGKYLPPRNVIEAACKIFDVSETWLMGLDTDLDIYSPEEINLIKCWRNASDDEKESVAFALRKHNFKFELKKEKIS